MRGTVAKQIRRTARMMPGVGPTQWAMNMQGMVVMTGYRKLVKSMKRGWRDGR